MKRETGIFSFAIRFVFLITATALSSQTAEIDHITVEHNVENRVYFRIYDLNVYAMKDGYIHTAFILSQNAEWIDDSEIALDPLYVPYDHSVWNGESFWFYYPYSAFTSYGNPIEPYWGTFLVINSSDDTLLLQEDIQFSLPESVTGMMRSDEDSGIAGDDGEINSTFYWTHSGKSYNTGFRISREDYYRSRVERDTFQPFRGRAEDTGEYISLWDIDFSEFYSDLYGYLYQQNSYRLGHVKEELLGFKEGLSLGYADFAAFVINCVQATTYQIPETPWGIYTPLEMIRSKKGDCDSRSVLLYLLLKDFGYDVAIFYSDYYQHAMLGIAQVGFGDYLSYGGIRYFFVETTATGWEIGDIPPEWSNKSHWIILFPILRN